MNKSLIFLLLLTFSITAFNNFPYYYYNESLPWSNTIISTDVANKIRVTFNDSIFPNNTMYYFIAMAEVRINNTADLIDVYANVTTSDTNNPGFVVGHASFDEQDAANTPSHTIPFQAVGCFSFPNTTGLINLTIYYNVTRGSTPNIGTNVSIRNARVFVFPNNSLSFDLCVQGAGQNETTVASNPPTPGSATVLSGSFTAVANQGYLVIGSAEASIDDPALGPATTKAQLEVDGTEVGLAQLGNTAHATYNHGSTPQFYFNVGGMNLSNFTSGGTHNVSWVLSETTGNPVSAYIRNAHIIVLADGDLNGSLVQSRKYSFSETSSLRSQNNDLAKTNHNYTQGGLSFFIATSTYQCDTISGYRIRFEERDTAPTNVSEINQTCYVNNDLYSTFSFNVVNLSDTSPITQLNNTIYHYTYSGLASDRIKYARIFSGKLRPFGCSCEINKPFNNTASCYYNNTVYCVNSFTQSGSGAPTDRSFLDLGIGSLHDVTFNCNGNTLSTADYGSPSYAVWINSSLNNNITIANCIFNGTIGGINPQSSAATPLRLNLTGVSFYNITTIPPLVLFGNLTTSSNFYFSNVSITNVIPPTSGFTLFSLTNFNSGTFVNISVVDNEYSTINSSGPAAISILNSSGLSFSNVSIFGGQQGLRLNLTNSSNFSNVTINRTLITPLVVVNSTNNTFTNLSVLNVESVSNADTSLSAYITNVVFNLISQVFRVFVVSSNYTVFNLTYVNDTLPNDVVYNNGFGVFLYKSLYSSVLYSQLNGTEVPLYLRKSNFTVVNNTFVNGSIIATHKYGIASVQSSNYSLTNVSVKSTGDSFVVGGDSTLPNSADTGDANNGLDTFITVNNSVFSSSQSNAIKVGSIGDLTTYSNFYFSNVSLSRSGSLSMAAPLCSLTNVTSGTFVNISVVDNEYSTINSSGPAAVSILNSSGLSFSNVSIFGGQQGLRLNLTNSSNFSNVTINRTLTSPLVVVNSTNNTFTNLSVLNVESSSGADPSLSAYITNIVFNTMFKVFRVFVVSSNYTVFNLTYVNDTLPNDVVYNNGFGVFLYKSLYSSVLYSQLNGTEVPLYLRKSNFTVVNNTFVNSSIIAAHKYGIASAKSSNYSLTNVSVKSTGDSFVVGGDSTLPAYADTGDTDTGLDKFITVINSVFSSSAKSIKVGNDISSVDPLVLFINSSNSSVFQVMGTLGIIYAQNYIRALVKNATSPYAAVSGAVVNFSQSALISLDNDYPITNYTNVLTDVNGYTPYQLVTRYKQNSSGSFNFTFYNITANATGEVAFTLNYTNRSTASSDETNTILLPGPSIPYVAFTLNANLSTAGINFGGNLTENTIHNNATYNSRAASNPTVDAAGTGYSVTISSDTNTNTVTLCTNASSPGSANFVSGSNSFSVTYLAYYVSSNAVSPPNVSAANMTGTLTATNNGTSLAANNIRYFNYWLTIPAGQATGTYTTKTYIQATSDGGGCT